MFWESIRLLEQIEIVVVCQKHNSRCHLVCENDSWSPIAARSWAWESSGATSASDWGRGRFFLSAGVSSWRRWWSKATCICSVCSIRFRRNRRSNYCHVGLRSLSIGSSTAQFNVWVSLQGDSTICHDVVFGAISLGHNYRFDWGYKSDIIWGEFRDQILLKLIKLF